MDGVSTGDGGHADTSDKSLTPSPNLSLTIWTPYVAFTTSIPISGASPADTTGR